MSNFENVVLVGNANTGKTTIFNALTKQNQKTGNWHGVTNAIASAVFKYDNKEYKLYDIPGIYSLTPLSFEEQVATEFVLQNTEYLFLNICEQDNIHRNLYLTLQLLELGVQTILIVNTKGKDCKVNLKKMSNELNITVLNYTNKKDIKYIKNEIKNYKKRNIKKADYINKILYKYQFNIEKKHIKNEQELKQNQNKRSNEKLKNIKKRDFFNKKCDFCDKKCELVAKTESFNIENINKDFVKIKLLEQDQFFLNEYEKPFEDAIEYIAKERYSYIDKIIDNKLKTNVYGQSKLDKILLNKFLALPIFFVFLIAIFYLTFFSFGAFISELFQNLISQFGKSFIYFLSVYLNNGWFLDLIDSAVIGSLGSLLSFLPQVCLLFLFLTILEDSGYLSRVAFLFEDILSKVGLSGKGVYTLLMGFGCSATSIMTARNMEDKNAKIKVALITPYFSCSAKLPIFAVLGGAFFGAQNVFVIFGLYLLGVVVGVILCALMDKFLWKSKKQSFILEFAPLKPISISRILKVTWDNVKQFLIRIGSLIICINVIVFIISSFSFDFKYVKVLGGESMLESLGKLIAPIFAPLGFGNWGSASALLAGLIAKEIVISSIAIFNGVSSNNSKLKTSLYDPTSAVFFTPFSALSFLVFCLLYTPCVTTLAVIKKELGTKYALFAFIFQFGLAYIVSFFVYSLISFNITSLLILLVLLIGLLTYILIKSIKKKKYSLSKTYNT